MSQDQHQQGSSDQNLPTNFFEYDVMQFEDEFYRDTQSLGENEDETSIQLVKAFGSIFQSEFQKEMQKVTNQHSLSPRARKQPKQHNNHTSNNASANSSRPNTRSRSRDFY